MTTYLIDTSVAVGYMRGGIDLSTFQREAQLASNTMIIAELYFGARRSGREEYQRALTNRFLKSCDIYSLDAGTADIYSEIKADLSAAGQLISHNTMWIAATAVQYGLTLVTLSAFY